ncbi:DUF2799 domain-containing protein [Vibrio sp. Isolate30]|uniref:DUF2799 domain-containing protein n=1 Tax=Vibrio sp. Isolate30 TaxID=2908536 RepID=UPI001EFECB36|nr:DUF2799 domain-containing protein [Vibrio sp. Isolate30]MCG9631555.1 DUF2799 domain-containing protein [Vibrio sp. Isolate30]
MKRIISTLMFTLVLSACSQTPKTAAEFWYGQGERFGLHGYAINNDSLESVKEKVPFDEDAYKEGYLKGKAEYCDPFKAFEKGIRGTRYTGQCEGMPNEDMLKAEWQRGWDTFIGADFYRFR